MRIILVIVLVCLVLGSGDTTLVLASTDTPTPSPTATATMIPTPDVNQFWTLPPSTNEAGTPVPSRDVFFTYSSDVGDIAIIAFMGAIIFSGWGIMFMIWRSNRSKGKPNV